MAKPTYSHDWARVDQVDPTSGKNNAVEPSETLKNYGWSYKARPARQAINYLFRAISGWLHWIEDEYDLFMPRIGTLETDLATETSTREGADTAEASARDAADDILEDWIFNEITNRENADTTLQGNIDTVSGNLATEVTTRGDADTALDGRLDSYDADTTELSGILKMFGYTTDLNVNVYAQVHRHRSSDGSSLTLTEVVLYLPTVTGTSDNGNLGFQSSDIPAGLRPDDDQYVPIVAVDNNAGIVGYLHCTVTGNWVIHRIDDAAFASSSVKGVRAQIVRYRKSIA